MNEDDFDLDEDNTVIRSRKDHFLKSMEDKLDLSDSLQKERFSQIKNQILERVKTTKVSRYRSRSGSSVSSEISLRKRSPSGEPDASRPHSRPKPSPPPVSAK